MTVALVYPPLWDSIDSPPLGPAVLAGALREAGIATCFVDLNLAFHTWLFADATLHWLLEFTRGAAHAEETAGLEQLLAHPASQRAAQPERTAPLMALAYLLGMGGRPVLGPQRFLVGVASSKVRLDDLIDGSSTSEAQLHSFWDRWLDDQLAGLIAQQPSVVAMTISYVGQLLPAIKIAQALRRKLSPAPRILAGGPWCTHQAVSGVDIRPLFAALDGIGVGPGDQVIVRVAQSAPALPENVAGLWRRGDARPPELDRPAPTSPDFSSMPLTHYFAAGPPRYPLESSRGCWAECRYCNYPALNRGYRVKPIEQIAHEVIAIHERHPGAEITFVDDTILPKRALLMAEVIGRIAAARGHAMPWSGCLRPDAGLSAEECRALVQGGMWRVFIGFDAATQDLLDGIDKRVTLDDIRSLVRHYQSAGIVVAGNFILGLPGETLAARDAVLPLMKELGLDPAHVTTSLFSLVRGSWYYDHMDEIGWPALWVERVRQNDVLTDFLPAYALPVLQ